MDIKHLLVLQQEVINSFDAPAPENELVHYDLIEHPEYLEDEFSHY